MEFNRTKEFKKDNEWGIWGEGVVINFIESIFNIKGKFVSYWYNSSDITKNKGEMKKWDLRFGIYSISDRKDWVDKFEVEVKTDGYEINTGNLIFEKSCGRKKSGVFATTAKYFVYFTPLYSTDNMYIIKSEKLKEILSNFNTHIVSGGDDGSNTMMYKIHRSDFNEVFKSAGGKILTYTEYSIPDRFNKEKFINKYITYSEEIKNYPDPFDWKE